VSKSAEENEVKIAVSSVARTRTLLREKGYALSSRRSYEQNIVLDLADGSVRASGRLIRVRTVGKKISAPTRVSSFLVHTGVVKNENLKRVI